jgi:phage repressor protein C with HTH and peptisase S24 domain
VRKNRTLIVKMKGQSKAALGLKRLRERTGMSVREVAAAIGRPTSTYASYEDKYKKRYLPADLILDLLPIFSARGVGENELKALSGLVGARDRGTTKTREMQPISLRGAEKSPTIAEVDVRAAMGAGSQDMNDTKVVNRWSLPTEFIRVATNAALEKIRIITVVGDSMPVTFRPYDKVMVDTEDKTPSPPGIFVVWDGLSLVLKRVEYIAHSEPPRVRILSENPEYQPYERVVDEAYIQGRVLGKWQWT